MVGRMGDGIEADPGLTLFAVWNDDVIGHGRIPQTLMQVALRG